MEAIMQNLLTQLTGPEQALLLAIYRLKFVDDFDSNKVLHDMHLDFGGDIASLQSYGLIEVINNVPKITLIGNFNISIMLLELSLNIFKKNPDKSYPWHNQKESGGDAGLELAKYG